MAEIMKVPAIRFNRFSGEWIENEVGAFYDFKNGLNKGKEFFGYGTPIVNFTDVFHNRGIRAVKLKGKVCLTPSEIANFSVQQGDIFFTRTSETIEEIGFSSVMLDSVENTVFSGFVLRARAIKEDPLTLRFKQYVFFTDLFRAEMVKKSSMTTRALTSGTAIKKMNICFPLNQEEQSKIGLYIQHLDKLISLHKAKVNQLANLKKAMLEKMFPKQGTDVPEIRFKGFAGAWEEKALSDFGAATSGTSIESEFSDDGKYKVISIGSYSENSTYTDQGLRAIESEKTIKRVLNKDDLAMVLNDKTLSGNIIGRVLKVENSGTYVYNQRTQRIEPNKEKYDATFLYQLLNAPLVRNKIFRNAQGNTQIYVNWSKVKELKYLIPKLHEQKKIGLYFQNLDKSIALHQTELEKLTNLKKACLEKMFV